jgi:hypothetical protein
MDDGRPLRTTDVLSRKIEDLKVATGIYYVVQLGWDDWPQGEEAVQGILCDSGCDCEDSAVRSSRLLEGPVLRVDAVETVPELAVHQKVRRSWLASYLFREEEEPDRRWPNGDRQLPPAWRPMPPPRSRDTVPLAVLLPPSGDGGWELDTWMVRRDRGAPPPVRHWEWRLRMRPWDVFVAQVLQFQAQVADEGRPLGGDAMAAEWRDRLRRHLEQRERDTGYGDVQEVAWLKDTMPQLSVVQYSDKRERGPALAPGELLVELPPAGFVPSDFNELDEVRRAVESYLNSTEIVRRVCRCALGDVGRLFSDAQHRDRTRTAGSAEGGETQAIDVYVPSRDNERLTGWVLFTRAERVDCPEPEESEPEEPEPEEPKNEEPVPDEGRTERSSSRSTARTTPVRTAKKTPAPAAKKPPVRTTPRSRR